MALSPDQQKEVKNNELFGNAAAYHAATAFTDHVEAKGLPESQAEAQKTIIGYAQDFIDNHVDNKGVGIEKEQALKMASESLQKTIDDPNPEAWRIKHDTSGKAFDTWASPEKQQGAVIVQSGIVWPGCFPPRPGRW